jgi:hypothetical protein
VGCHTSHTRTAASRPRAAERAPPHRIRLSGRPPGSFSSARAAAASRSRSESHSRGARHHCGVARRLGGREARERRPRRGRWRQSTLACHMLRSLRPRCRQRQLPLPPPRLPRIATLPPRTTSESGRPAPPHAGRHVESVCRVVRIRVSARSPAPLPHQQLRSTREGCAGDIQGKERHGEAQVQRFNNQQTKKSFRPARLGTALRASTAINTAGATRAILQADAGRRRPAMGQAVLIAVDAGAGCGLSRWRRADGGSCGPAGGAGDPGPSDRLPIRSAYVYAASIIKLGP